MATYLPAQGEGMTMATQAVTAFAKLEYRWYNDGDVYDNRYQLEGWYNDLSSYANWLAKYVVGTLAILQQIYDADEAGYGRILEQLADYVLNEALLIELNKREREGSIYGCAGEFKFEIKSEEEDW